MNSKNEETGILQFQGPAIEVQPAARSVGRGDTNEQFAMPSPDGASRVFAVIGHPVSQVQAPTLMNELFVRRSVRAVMVPVEVSPENFSAALEGMKRIDNLDGILITVPHKFAASGHAHLRSAAVDFTGSANALRRETDGTWSAENFDGIGFVAGLKSAGHSPEGKTVTLFGAGGAGVSIAQALLAANAGRVLLTDTAVERAEWLAQRLSTKWPGKAVVTNGAALFETDIVVNATPIGLQADDPLPFDIDLLTQQTVVADIIMKPAETRLLKSAAARGLRIHYGIHMLNEQIELYRQFFRIP